MTGPARAGWVGALLVLVGACAHYPPNAHLVRHDPATGYRAQRLADTEPVAPNTNSLFVCLTFSGGGTRAAALAYGVLEHLRDTRVPWQGVERRLLDEVDCISSVSGGSFTAAYYGLFGRRIFEDFRTRFLGRSIELELTGRALAPWNLVRLASPWFSRIDLAAELYDETVFEGRTFADFGAGRRPFVILNATNLLDGERFEFTQEEFDLLGSDLATYPVGRAVAASSAFPFLLSPLTLVNHPPAAGFALRDDDDLVLGLKDYEKNRSRYEWASRRMRYVQAENNDKVLKSLHLMDGGLADNIGLRALVTAWKRSSGFLRQLVNNERIERLVIIVVNARTQAEDRLSRRTRAPGLITVGLKTATLPMDNYSFETIELMKNLASEREQALKIVKACQTLLDARCPGGPPLPPLPTLRTCIVEVNFETIRDLERRRYFLGLPTSFTLDPQDLDALIAVAKELLDDSPDFQRLLAALRRGDAPPPTAPGETPNCA